jgi:uncharacterized oxidoreductase
MKAVPPAPGVSEILLPGEPEARARAERTRDGVLLPEATWEAITEVANELGVKVGA